MAVLVISSGQTSGGVIVSSGVSVYVSGGGVATGIVESGGYVEVAEGVSASFVSNSFSGLVLDGKKATVHSGTTANSTTLRYTGSYGGEQTVLYVYDGGEANSTTVSGGGYVHVSNGGEANSTTLIGGYLYVHSGGTANTVSLDYNGGNYGYLRAYNGATVNDLVINSGRDWSVSNGVVVNRVAIHSYGSLYVSSGGTATGIVESGGYVEVAEGVSASFVSNSFSGLLLSGRSATLHSGTTANSTTLVRSGTYGSGILYVYDGGEANSTTVSGGGYVHVSNGGEANSTTLIGGYLYVHSGGTANTVSLDYKGGKLGAYNGATVNDLVINSGRDWSVSNGVVVNRVAIHSYGSLYVSGGGVATGIVESGGYVEVAEGASASFVSNSFSGLLLSGRSATLHSGTTANSTTLVRSGTYGSGILYVYDGGVANETVVDYGGRLYVSDGGVVNSTTLSGGGYVHVSNGGTAINTILERGTFEVHGGKVIGGTFDGTLTVYAGTEIYGINGNFTVRTVDAGSYTVSGSDLSNARFSFASGSVVDLSGNYFGIDDVDEIYSKYGFSRETVTIDSVLLTDPTTTFNVSVAGLTQNTFGAETESLTFLFSHEVDTSNFTDDSFRFVAADGTPVAVTGWSLDGKVLTVNFDTPAAEGKYLLSFADSIRDLSGAALETVNSDAGVDSGWADTLTLRADLTPPRVISVSPEGDFAGTLTEFRVNFSEAMAADEVAKYVTLTAPNGSVVKPLSVKVANGTAVFALSPQTAYGEYTIRVSRELADYAGNRIDGNGNGVGGEAADEFTAAFTIADVDLKVSDVRLSADTIKPGETLTVSWIDWNNGGYALSGSWTDGVYLSSDPRWDVNDILLGSVSHTGGLAKDATLENSLAVSVSGVSAGSYYLLVRSDIYMQEKGDRESALAAQNLEALPLAVELAELEVGGKVSGHVAKSGDYTVWKLMQEANESLRLVLDSKVSSANMEIYVGYGYVPTREKYDSKVQKITDGDLLLDASVSRRQVYVMVYNKGASAAFDYELDAENVPMSITKVTGTAQSNDDGSTFDISGVDFTPGTKVWLRDESGNKYEAEVSFVDPARIVATVAKGTLTDGKYSLVVEDGGETLDYSGDITIRNGAKAVLKASFYAPNQVGRHAAATLTVSCTNTGDAPLDAFMVTVAPTQSHASGPDTTGAFLTLDASKISSGFWTATMPSGFSTSVSFLVEGAESSQIMPGETVKTNIYYLGWRTDDWDFGNSHINWNVSYLTDAEQDDGSGSTEPLDWNDIIGADAYGAAARTHLVDNLTSGVGTTWGDYVKMLNRNKRYLSAMGVDAADLSAEDLFEFEVMQDTGALSPYRALQSSVDLSMVAPGAAPAISRSYDSDLLSRERSGSFGYGWNCGWDAELEISANGDLRFVRGASARLYQPNFSNGYQTVAGDGSVMKKTKTGYELTERDGTVWAFSARGVLTSVTDANGNSVACGYDANGRLVSLTHSCGEKITLTRNAAGYISAVADTHGNGASYTYDGSGNLTAVTDTASGATVVYAYSDDHELTRVTGIDGSSVAYTYGENGLLSGVSSRDGAERVSIAYGENGEVTLTDHLNGDVTYFYGHNGQVVRTVDNTTGVSTYYRYDGDGRMTSMYDSRGSSVGFAYYANGDLESMTDQFGNTAKFACNAKGSTIQLTDARGNVTGYAYDAKNNLTGAYYANGTCETYAYDGAGNPLSVTDVKGGVTSFTYDGQGRVTGMTFNGKSVAYEYDGRGNVTGVTYADGTKSRYAYNAFDELTGFTDANGNVTTYAYDDVGRATSATYADGTKESFAYNAAGDLVKWTNRRGGTVNYTVDAIGNTTKLDQSDGTVIEYAYDASGRMTAAGDLSFTYNDFDHVTGVTASDGRGIVYAYDAFDRVVSVSDGVNTTNYSYTVYGELDTLTDGAGVLIADYDYDRYGRLEKVTHGNGTFTTYAYNDYGEVTAVEHSGKDGSLTAYERYTYDADDLVATKTTADGTWSYTYDRAGQLTGAVLTKGEATLRSEAYTYDAMGNRLTSTIDGVTKTYTYDNMNRIASADGFAYRYDADGNLLEDELRTYTWTTDNRVAGETLKSTGQTWEYGYDAIGNRVRVTTNGVTTTYTVDANGNVLAEYVNGAFVRSYIQGNSLAAFTDASGSTYYFDSDLLGSTVGITNGAGATVNAYSYDSFGNVLSSTEGVANDFEFIGAYGLMKNASGTTFVRARNYDAATGRWISADPIGISGGENLYVYCGNDGINYIDDIGNDRILSASITASARVGAVSPAAGIVTTAILYSFDFYTEGDDFYFKSYGNWGGPGRVNGQSYGREHIWTENDRFPRRGEPGFVEPIDSRDELYYNHDVALHDAGRIADPQERQKARRRADIDLANGLKKLKKRYGDTGFEEWLFGKENSPNNTIGKYYPTAISISGKNSTISYSVDPNDKTVTEGYGEAGYVAEKAALNYKVEFENDPEWATAPARWVRVYDTLADEFDLDTFELKSICIAGNYIEVGDVRDSFNELRELDINGDKILTQISVNLDPETREIFAEFTAIDPETGWMLQDVERGILPPDDEIGSGEGFFTYSVALKEGVAHGTGITNTAKIYFDFNDPIETPTTLNTVDGVDPALAGFAVAATGSTITLSFAGEDADSGVAGYNILYSTDGENFMVYGYTTYAELAVNGAAGITYYFKAQAVDNVGNVSGWSEVKSVKLSGKPENLTGTQSGLTWNAVAGATGYVVEYSTDGFEHLVRLYTESNGVSSFRLPGGTYQWRVRAIESDEWVTGENIAADTAVAAPRLVESDADGNSDLFFAAANGTWGGKYAAQHLGASGDWEGTGEKVALSGKGRIADFYFGSTDTNTLLLTDDANGDALFVDDVYTALPGAVAEQQSRIARINEIRAGAGNDVVDLTSQRFEYIGDGLTVRGGLGDDTIWANKGDNMLFGDAGNDRLVGASGNDVLVGGVGNDSMHGGGGNDLFTFCDNWGNDTVEQLSDGSVTLWFASGSATNWDASTLTYIDGENSVTVKGVSSDKVTLKFGDDDSAQYAALMQQRAFADFTSEKIFEEKGRGILVSL